MKLSMMETYIRMYGMLRYIMRMNEKGYHPKMEEIRQHCTYFEDNREQFLHPNTVGDYMRETETFLGLEFRYDTNFGYYIANLSDWRVENDFLLGWLDMRWLKSVIAKDNLRQQILFESLPEGVAFVPDVLFAILNHHPIDVFYRKLGKKRGRARRLEPLGLRQFQNRLYVIAYVRNEKVTKTFAFHGITHVEVNYKEHFPSRNFSITEFFSDYTGIWVNHKRKAIDIKLRAANPFWANFMQNPPFHHSLRVLEKKDGTRWTDFVIHVVPMPDMIQTLLQFSPYIMVLEPPSLRQFMMRRLDASLAAYASPDAPLPDLSLPERFS